MYCRFCGKELPEDAIFCSKCGKLQGKNSGEEAEMIYPHKKKLPVPLILTILLSILCSRTVVLAVFFDYNIMWIIPFIAVMIVILVALYIKGKIHPDKIRKDALLFPLAILVLVVGEVCFLALLFRYGSLYGSAVVYAVSVFRLIYEALSAAGFLDMIWQCGLLILFLLLRSGIFRLPKICTVIPVIFLLLWSVAAFAVAPHLSERFCTFTETEVYSYTTLFLRVYYSTIWIQQLIIYIFVMLAGKGKLGTVRTILFPISVCVSSIMLLMFLVSMFHMPPHFMFYSLNGGYLVGLLILLTSYLPKLKRKQE